jgi:predicted GNAT superfamily acetyltransferase
MHFVNTRFLSQTESYEGLTDVARHVVQLKERGFRVCGRPYHGTITHHHHLHGHVHLLCDWMGVWKAGRGTGLAPGVDTPPPLTST